MERVVVDVGFPLVVRAWGGEDGRTLVYWPGLTPFCALHLNEVGPIWADTYGLRVLSISPPGVETPALAADDYGLSRLPEIVVRLLDALGLDRVAFAGYSWGASVGCHLGARFPERLTALCLLDAGYDDVADDGKTRETRIEEARAMQAGFRFPSREAFLEAAREGKQRWNAQAEARFLAGMREQDGELVVSASAEAAASALHGVIAEPPTAQLQVLGRTRLPVLLVTSGERAGGDEGRAAVERFRAAIPQSVVEHLPDSSHDVIGDEPEGVARIVGKFLERGVDWPPCRDI